MKFEKILLYLMKTSKSSEEHFFSLDKSVSLEVFLERTGACNPSHLSMP